MNAAGRAELFARFSTALPEPQTELDWSTPFELLVAVALSAQTTDRRVNEVTPALFRAAPTPQQMLDLGEERVVEMIRTIGLFRNKAKNLIAMSRLLVERFGGEVPDDRASLESLPGVGTKTASVVLNTVFRHPEIAVDTHIFRVSNRLGLARGATVAEVARGLQKQVPEAYRLNAHHWLILHGRYVCKARKPECWRCLVEDLCPYKPKTAEPSARR